MADSSASALSPPPGGDQSRGWEVLVVHSILLGIGIILLATRLYVRAVVVRNVGIDDCFIVLGVVSTTASNILGGWQIKWGFGRHIYYLLETPQSRDRLIQSYEISTILQVLTVFDLFFIKISIGIFLLRVFGTKKYCRWIVWSINCFVFMATVINAVTLFAQCRPLNKLWDSAAPGKCWSPKVVIRVGYYNGATSVFSDWALSSVPVVAMWNLQMSNKKKFGIAALMSLGYFTGATALVRTVLIGKLAGVDTTWDAIPLAIWAGIETRLGIIGACIPAIRPLFSSSRRLSSKGWGRTPPAEDDFPLQRVRVRNLDSISEALKTREDDSEASRTMYSHDTSGWTTAGGGNGRLPWHSFKLKTKVAVEEVEVPRTEDSREGTETAQERKLSNLV